MYEFRECCKFNKFFLIWFIFLKIMSNFVENWCKLSERANLFEFLRGAA